MDEVAGVQAACCGLSIPTDWVECSAELVVRAVFSGANRAWCQVAGYFSYRLFPCINVSILNL